MSKQRQAPASVVPGSIEPTGWERMEAYRFGEQVPLTGEQRDALAMQFARFRAKLLSLWQAGEKQRGRV